MGFIFFNQCSTLHLHATHRPVEINKEKEGCVSCMIVL